MRVHYFSVSVSHVHSHPSPVALKFQLPWQTESRPHPYHITDRSQEGSTPTIEQQVCQPKETTIGVMKPVG
jgi:hypothetical protein